MNKILSIVIPTYNMEAYLHNCLDSLIVSQDALKYLEVLVINDGSTDHSSVIAKEYENLYPSIFRLIEKENGHYGSCVNRGLMEARGKYIKILDADDFFDKTVLEAFLYFLMNTDVDMVVTDYNKIGTDGIVRRRIKHSLPTNKICEIEDYCMKDVFTSLQMHAVTYKKEILVSHHYCQSTGVPYTDQEWMFLPITYMENFLYFNRALYQYFIGRKGQTVDIKIFLKNIRIVFNLILKRVDLLNKLEDSTINKKNYLKNRLLSDLAFVYRHGIIRKNISDSSLRTFDNDLKDINHSLYEEVANSKVGKIYGCDYIILWRQNRETPFFLNLILSFRDVMSMLKSEYIVFKQKVYQFV